MAEIISGQSPPSESYRNTPGGLPFFQGKADFGELHPLARVWCVAPERIAEPGDILLSVRAPVGPTNVADVRCCIGRGLAAIRPSVGVDRDFILLALRWFESSLAQLGSGSTFAAVTRKQLKTIQVPTPSSSEQQRLSAQAIRELAQVERARAAVAVQLAAVAKLAPAHLRALFSDVKMWPSRVLGEVGALLPAKSISTNADAEVLAVTTACLTETGFDERGTKTARMRSADVPQCTLRPGEILIARSNTPDLVGRVAVFPGMEQPAVASDVTIRLWCNDLAVPQFVSAYLSYLYLSGYWKERAGGASGTMKKITRPQILGLKVPLPAPDEQRMISDSLERKMGATLNCRSELQSQVESIERLPDALLRAALSGEL